MASFVLMILVIAIGVPVFLAMIGTLGKQWIQLKERQLDHAAHLAADKAAGQAAHIDKLEERVRVLERIATDKGVTLADQIDALDDARLN
jgi:uncharacterized membrane protein